MKVLDHFSGAKRRQARGKPGQEKGRVFGAPGQLAFR